MGILFPLFSPTWAQEYSELWGATGEKWSPTSRLPDFSFAGYHSGEKPIPTIPLTANVKSYGAKGDGQHEDSQSFLDAIAVTSHGTILIPAGCYKISQILEIHQGGIVLRGASPAETVLWYWTKKAGRCRLVCWGANDTAIKYHVRIHEGDTFRVETQGGQLFANKPKLTDGEWHHLACVFPPGGKMCHDHILYVDGVEIKDRGGNNVGVDTDTKTNDVEIGWNKWVGHGDPAQGVFDEVAIFSTALSEKDVNDIMNKGLAVALSVSPKEKLTTIWGSLKTIRYLGN